MLGIIGTSTIILHQLQSEHNYKTDSKQIILIQHLIIENVGELSNPINKNNYEISVFLDNIPTHLLISKCKHNNL